MEKYIGELIDFLGFPGENIHIQFNSVYFCNFFIIQDLLLLQEIKHSIMHYKYTYIYRLYDTVSGISKNAGVYIL